MSDLECPTCGKPKSEAYCMCWKDCPDQKDCNESARWAVELHREQAKLQAANKSLEAEVRRLKMALEKLRSKHYVCEDPWYSCELSEDGAIQGDYPKRCTCGAEHKNKIIDIALNPQEEAGKE